MRWILVTASLGIILGGSAIAQELEKPKSHPEQQKHYPDSVFDEKGRSGDDGQRGYPDSVFDEKSGSGDDGQRRYPDSVFDEKRPDGDAQRQAPNPRFDGKGRSRELEQGRQIRDGHPERKMRDR